MPKHKYGTSGKSILRSASPDNETHSTDSNSLGNEDDRGGQSSDDDTEVDSDVQEYPGTSVDVGNFEKSFSPIDRRDESRTSFLDGAMETNRKTMEKINHVEIIVKGNIKKIREVIKSRSEQRKDHEQQEGKDDYITLSESDDDDECTIDPDTPGPSQTNPKKMKLDRPIPRPGSVLMDSRRATETPEDRSLPCPVPCRVSASQDQSNGTAPSSSDILIQASLINNRLRKKRLRGSRSREDVENVRLELNNGTPTIEQSSEMPELQTEEEGRENREHFGEESSEMPDLQTEEGDRENREIFGDCSRRRKRTLCPKTTSESLKRVLQLAPSTSRDSHEIEEALEEDIEVVDQTILDSDGAPPRKDAAALSSSRKATNDQPDCSKSVREGLCSNRRKKLIKAKQPQSQASPSSSSNKSSDEQNKEAQALTKVPKARKGPQTPTGEPETPPEVGPYNTAAIREELREEMREEFELRATVYRDKYDNLVSVLKSKVECPVCFEVPKAPPIPVCPNGHIICTKCVQRQPLCPTCRVRMADGKSVIAVTIIDHIPLNCEFQDSGCQVNCGMTELQLHMKSCPFRTVICPNFSCDLQIPLSELAEHTLKKCIHTHTFKSSPLLTNYNYVIGEIQQNTMFDVRRNSTWRPDGIAFDGKNFFLKIMRKARKSLWYFYVQMAGSEEESSHYVAILQVFRPSDNKAIVEGKNSSRLVTGVCPIDISRIDTAANNGYCKLLTDITMKQMLKEVPLKRTGNDPLSKKYEFAVSVNLQRREDYEKDLEEELAGPSRKKKGPGHSKELEEKDKRIKELENMVKALTKASPGIDLSKEEDLQKRNNELEKMNKELKKSQNQRSSPENKSSNESHSPAFSSSSSSSGVADEEMNVDENNERFDYLEIE